MSYRAFALALFFGLSAVASWAGDGSTPISETRPLSLTAEVVTTDRAGIHLVDRGGQFWVLQGASADPKTLRRGTMIAVTGDVAPRRAADLERPIVSNSYKVVEAAQVGVPFKFGGTFEANGQTPVLLRGTVERIEWTPLVRLHLSVVTTPGQPPQAWLAELPDISVLARSGQGPETLKPGTAVVVRAYQSSDRVCIPECKAMVRDLTIPDGRKIYMNGGRGAPRDAEAG